MWRLHVREICSSGTLTAHQQSNVRNGMVKILTKTRVICNQVFCYKWFKICHLKNTKQHISEHHELLSIFKKILFLLRSTCAWEHLSLVSDPPPPPSPSNHTRTSNLLLTFLKKTFTQVSHWLIVGLLFLFYLFSRPCLT